MQVVMLSDMDDLIQNSLDPCECCGGSKRLNPHRMDKSKVRVLRDMARLQTDNLWIRVEGGRGLQGQVTGKWIRSSYDSATLANRLNWYGLIDQQKYRAANWRVNINGFMFLRGRLSVPAKILCRHGTVIYASKEMTFITDIRETFDKSYWDQYPWPEINPLNMQRDMF